MSEERICACGCKRVLPPWKPIYIKGHHPSRRPPIPLEDRFWPKVNKTEQCWEWLAAKGPTGYGSFWDAARKHMVGAHIISWELAHGPVPEGLELDHLCKNRGCVRPDHLEPVLHAENVRRGDYRSNNANARKTHCPAGHRYSAENTYIGPKGTRFCRTCAREKQAQLRAAGYYREWEAKQRATRSSP